MDLDEVLKLLKIEELSREQPNLQAIKVSAMKKLQAISLDEALLLADVATAEAEKAAKVVSKPAKAAKGMSKEDAEDHIERRA